MGDFIKYLSASTLKREAASILMIWYLSIGTWLITTVPIPMAKEMWESLTLVVFALFAGAFGLDWISKQTNIAGPPANTETTQKIETTDEGTTVTTKSEPTT